MLKKWLFIVNSLHEVLRVSWRKLCTNRQLITYLITKYFPNNLPKVSDNWYLTKSYIYIYLSTWTLSRLLTRNIVLLRWFLEKRKLRQLAKLRLYGLTVMNDMRIQFIVNWILNSTNLFALPLFLWTIVLTCSIHKVSH